MECKSSAKSQRFWMENFFMEGPVTVKLAKSGLQMDTIGPLCGMEEETIDHLLTTCEVIKQIWYVLPLRINFDRSQSLSFVNWVVDIGKEKDSWWGLLWSLVWGIWIKCKK